MFGIEPGKGRGNVLPHRREPAEIPCSCEPPGQWSAAVAVLGPPGEALLTRGGLDPRDRCALGRLHQEVCPSPMVQGQHGVSCVVQRGKFLHCKGGQGLKEAAQGGGRITVPGSF